MATSGPENSSEKKCFQFSSEGDPADTVSEVGRSCAIKTAERQNTEAAPYPLWDAQPVEIAHIDTLYVRALKEIC